MELGGFIPAVGGAVPVVLVPVVEPQPVRTRSAVAATPANRVRTSPLGACVHAPSFAVSMTYLCSGAQATRTRWPSRLTARPAVSLF